VTGAPSTWIAGGAAVGLLIAARMPRTDRVEIHREAPDAHPGTAAAVFSRMAKIALALVRPTLSRSVRHRTAGPAQ